MYKKISLVTKKSINSNVSQIKDFWLRDDAVDFITKVGYLFNGYYVPTKIDNDLEKSLPNHGERLSPNEIIRVHIATVILGGVEPEKALEGIKREFYENGYLIAKSIDDESAEPKEV